MSNELMFHIVSFESELKLTNVNSVSLPAYDGELTILKDHEKSVFLLVKEGNIAVVCGDEERRFFVKNPIATIQDNVCVVLSDSYSEQEVT